MKLQLTDVRGIGPSAAQVLKAQGIQTVESLAKASKDKITATHGFGDTRATEVIASAIALLAVSGVPETGESSPRGNGAAAELTAKKEKKEKKAKKEKKGKKDKKKDKKKKDKKNKKGKKKNKKGKSKKKK